MARVLVALLLLLLAAVVLGVQQPAVSRNPYPYVIANPLPNAPPMKHRGEYFDVLSEPITTQYSQVYWTKQDPVPLPEDFVQRYKGKVASIIGVEADVVRAKADGTYESVPCYEQYNHHYAAYLQGVNSALAYVGKRTYLEDYRVSPAHRHSPLYQPRSLPSDPTPDSLVPTAQLFVQGNGNEHRRSFKYLAKGFTQLIESPNVFVLQPMMINTKNPNGPGRGGPLPRTSMAPPGANYSGLMECPCTTRTEKVFTSHEIQITGTCSDPVSTPDECFTAAKALGLAPAMSAHTINNGTSPSGCFVLAGPRGYDVFFNAFSNSTMLCGDNSGEAVRAVGSQSAEVDLHVDLDGKADKATITITGPSVGWFGVGFGATAMKDAPYAIIVNGDGTVEERKLANHDPGRVLSPPSITIVSNTVVDGKRTVELTRTLKGATADHYTFNPKVTGFSFISARNNATKTISFHGDNREGSALLLVELGAPSCVCRGKVAGSINGLPFTSDCMSEPETDVAAQKNPSCSIETYNGGLFCCHHGVRLLDADQDVPPATDTFHMMFRFFYEDPEPEEKNAFFVFHEVEANHGEYDVPKCLNGTSSEDCVYTITGRWQVKDMIRKCRDRADPWCAPSSPTFPQSQKIAMVHASGHCHGPACMSMELYNADTGELICAVKPILGEGDEPMNEAGYVVGIPPCSWGSAEEGMAEPPVLDLNTNLMSVKKSNSTNYHYGVMSHWQMRAVWA
eukprot:scpid42913/ scgid31984/ 